MYYLFYRLTNFFYDLDLTDDLGVLWLWDKGNVLRLLSYILSEKLLIESVVLIIILAIRNREAIIPCSAVQFYPLLGFNHATHTALFGAELELSTSHNITLIISILSHIGGELSIL